jgi:hypothetical protein
MDRMRFCRLHRLVPATRVLVSLWYGAGWGRLIPAKVLTSEVRGGVVIGRCLACAFPALTAYPCASLDPVADDFNFVPAPDEAVAEQPGRAREVVSRVCGESCGSGLGGACPPG